VAATAALAEAAPEAAAAAAAAATRAARGTDRVCLYARPQRPVSTATVGTQT